MYPIKKNNGEAKCIDIYEERAIHQATKFYALIVILQKVIQEYAHIRGQGNDRSKKENVRPIQQGVKG